MESLLPAWLQEVARQGLGYILFLASLYVLYRKDTELQACKEQARQDAIKMAIALEQAAKAISDTTEVERQRIETDKVNAEVLKATIKQQDLSDERAKDRAAGIETRIDGIVAKFETMLTRAVGSGRRGSV